MTILSDLAHPVGTCTTCGTTGPLHARGLCGACYNRGVTRRTAAERAARNGDLAAWTHGAADSGPAWSPATWALAKQLVPPDRALPGKPAAPALPPKARYRCGPVRWARLLEDADARAG